MSPLAWFLAIGCAAVASAISVLMVAADKKRFLAGFDLNRWRDAYYLRALPNFLGALHERGCKSPWPIRCNAVSAVFFRLRMRRLVRNDPELGRRDFLRHHLTLFALIEQQRMFIDDYVLQEKHRIISARLIDMTDTVDRDRLALHLDMLRATRAAFARSLTIYDRGILAVIVHRRFISRLRLAHAIFQEHGYSLLPDFETLRHWEASSGVDIAQEIPRELSRRHKKHAAWLFHS